MFSNGNIIYVLSGMWGVRRFNPVVTPHSKGQGFVLFIVGRMSGLWTGQTYLKAMQTGR